VDTLGVTRSDQNVTNVDVTIGIRYLSRSLKAVLAARKKKKRDDEAIVAFCLAGLRYHMLIRHFLWQVSEGQSGQVASHFCELRSTFIEIFKRKCLKDANHSLYSHLDYLQEQEGLYFSEVIAEMKERLGYVISKVKAGRNI
jgi:hypothetical protein